MGVPSEIQASKNTENKQAGGKKLTSNKFLLWSELLSFTKYHSTGSTQKQEQKRNKSAWNLKRTNITSLELKDKNNERKT